MDALQKLPKHASSYYPKFENTREVTRSSSGLSIGYEKERSIEERWKIPFSRNQHDQHNQHDSGTNASQKRNVKTRNYDSSYYMDESRQKHALGVECPTVGAP